MPKELVIAPHPDDEIMGCGGTILKLLENKHQVGIVYLSSGDDIEAIREDEARSVCSYLNIDYYHFLRLKGPTFVADMDNINRLMTIYHDFQPDFLFINHPDDGDHEHKVAYDIINQSFWRFNNSNRTRPIGGLAYYEVHKPMSKYHIVEVIDSQMEQKLEALRLYQSQLTQVRLAQAIAGLNRYRGIMHEGCEYAEVFQLHKIRNLSELVRS